MDDKTKELTKAKKRFAIYAKIIASSIVLYHLAAYFAGLGQGSTGKAMSVAMGPFLLFAPIICILLLLAVPSMIKLIANSLHRWQAGQSIILLLIVLLFIVYSGLGYFGYPADYRYPSSFGIFSGFGWALLAIGQLLTIYSVLVIVFAKELGDIAKLICAIAVAALHITMINVQLFNWPLVPIVMLIIFSIILGYKYLSIATIIKDTAVIMIAISLVPLAMYGMMVPIDSYQVILPASNTYSTRDYEVASMCRGMQVRNDLILGESLEKVKATCQFNNPMDAFSPKTYYLYLF